MMRQKEKERGRSRRARTMPVSDQICHFLGRVQWKRKLAAVLVATFLTGTMADGLSAVGLGNYANAYAATSSDASRSDAVHLDSDDLPAKGSSLDYYLEDGDERNLYLSETAIQEVLEALEEDEDAEELQLDVDLFGYDDPRAVVAVYDEIQKATKGYQLVLQGTFEEEGELSYFIYAKKSKKKTGPKFEDLQIVVINPSSAADEDGQYNVRIWYDGEELRLEDGKVTLKEMKELSRQQKKAAKGESLEEEAGDAANAAGPGASQEEGTTGEIVINGASGGGSGSSGSGGSWAGGSQSQDQVQEEENKLPSASGSGDSMAEDGKDHGSPEEVDPGNFDQNDQEEADPGSKDTDQNLPDSGPQDNPDSSRPSDGHDNQEQSPEQGQNPSDTSDGRDKEDNGSGSAEQEAGSGNTSDSGNDSSQSANDGNDSGSGAVSTDQGSTGSSQPGGSADSDKSSSTDSDKSGGSADNSQSGNSAERSQSSGGADSSQSDGGGEAAPADTASIGISRKWIPMVAASLASSSEGRKDDEAGNTAETIAVIREELASEGLKPYKLDPTGRFDLSELEMKLINQEEITEEDLEEAQGKEKNFLSKMFSSMSSVFAVDHSEEKEEEAPKEEISLEDLVGPDSSEYPAVLGLRQNTVVFVQSNMKKTAAKTAAGDLNWDDCLPVKDGDVFFYGAEYPAAVLLPETGVVTDEEGNEYSVSLQITSDGVSWNSESGAPFQMSQEPEEETSTTYTLTYQAFAGEEELEGEEYQKEIIITASKVHFNLPEFEFFIVGREYDLLDGGKVTAEDNTAKRNLYSCRPESVTYELIDPQQTETWEWDGAVIFTPFQKAKSHTIRYEAYIEYPGGTVVIGQSDDVEVKVYQSGDLGETVDQAGDVAYVEVSLNKDSFQTGTEPFDTRDESKINEKGYAPGDDWMAGDNILRTFDTASFNVEITSRVRDDSPYRHYKTGTLCFELILPGSSSEITFDTDNMGWLHSKANIQIETDEKGNLVTTKMRDGKEVQVLRGSFLWEPTHGGENAIGESTQELKVVLRALRLENGKEIIPEATFWLGVNDVGEGAELIKKEGDTEGSAVGYRFPDRLITGSNEACAQHKTEEYVTVKTDPIIISARPMYNVELQLDGYTNTAVNKFDFTTGNDKAPNKDHKEIKEGRMGSLGAVLQICGKGNGTGLRGVEFPNLTQRITFDISLDSTFRPEGSDTDVEINYYKPLLWSAEENSYEGEDGGRKQSDGRYLEGKFTDTCARSVPLNRPRRNGGNRNSSCYNGGTWTISQDAYQEGIDSTGKVTSVSGGTIHAVVEGFEITEDLSMIPNTYPASGNEQDGAYYTRGSIDHYWELDTLCFSAGEFWLVQPFYRKDAKGNDILVLNDVEAIGQTCVAGVFSVTAEDSNLQMVSLTGQSGPQARTSDDSRNTAYNYRLPGSYISMIQYNTVAMNWSVPLTSGCWDNGGDWAALGTEMSLQCRIDHDGTDGNECGVAYDALVKFDDAMFDPLLEIGGTSPQNSDITRVYYGVRKENPKKGWNHGNTKTPADAGYDREMIDASFNDLDFYTLEEYKHLKETENYVCVAVLCEWRGDYSWQMTHNHFFVKGRVKNDPSLIGNVYMITQNTRAWERKDVVPEAIEYLKENGYSVSKEEDITDEMWLKYAQNGFPTNAKDPSNGLKHYPGNFTKWTNEYNGDANYQKTQYFANGSSEDHTSRYIGDSCLIVGYRATIQKSTAQKLSGQSQAQVYYDLDVGQRVADYVLTPAIVRNGGAQGSETEDSQFVIDTLVVEDYLPKGLTYKPGSSYIGGTYESNGAGQQGQPTGVHIPSENTEIDLTHISGNKAGTVKLTVDPNADFETSRKLNTETEKYEVITEKRVKLTWTFRNVHLDTKPRTELDKIYYSCDIGDLSVSANDVKDGQGLENTVTVGGTQLSPTYTLEEGNKAVFEIKVSKLSSTNVFKKAKQTAVEVGDPMGFSLKIGNNAENPTDIIGYDVVPFNGDPDGTNVSSGKISLTKVTVSCDNQSVMSQLNTESGIRFYYTTNPEYRNRSSAYYMDTDATTKVLKMDRFWAEVEAGSWTQMDISSSNPTHTFSGTNEVSVIVAVGQLPAQTTLSLDTEVQIQDAKPGDYVGTTLSNRDLKSTAHSFVVNRALEGLVWLDANYNGVQDGNEPKLENVKVTLKKKEGASYTEIGSTLLGTAWDVHNNRPVEGNTAPGSYRFVNLPAGEFVVEFTGTGREGEDKGLFKIIGQNREIPLEQCVITKQHQGDARYDSDAEVVFAGNSSDENGKHGEILNITMPAIDQIQVQNYTVRNQDMGIYLPTGNLTFDKIDSESKEGLADVEFELKAVKLDDDDTFKYWAKAWITFLSRSSEAWRNTAGIKLIEGEMPTSGDASLTVKFTTVNGHVDFSAGNAGWMLPQGKYTLTETKALPGYTKADPIVFYILPGENSYASGGDMKGAAYIGTNAVFTGARAIQNIPQEYTIAKVTEEKKQPLAGAEFTIYQVNLDGETPVKTVSCDNTGKGTFFQSGLTKNQLYALKETKVPAGYTAADIIYFKLVSNEVPDSNLLMLQLCTADGNESTYTYAQLNDRRLELTIEDTLQTGSLTLRKELTGKETIGDPNAEKEFLFSMTLKQPQGYSRPAAPLALEEKGGRLYLKAERISADSAGNETAQPVLYPVVLGAENGIVSEIKLRAGESVRFNGIYYGTTFHIVENQNIPTGFQFSGGTSTGSQKISVNVAGAAIYGKTVQGENNLVVTAENTVKLTSLPLVKTFNSDIPSILPVFQVYDITGREPFQSADEAPGEEDVTWVDTITIEAQEDGTYTGCSREVLIPGHTYQVAEYLDPNASYSNAYDAKVSEPVTVTVDMENQTNTLVLNPGAVAITNERSYGWLTISKRLNDYYGEESKEQRTFFYRIYPVDEKGAEGEPLTLPAKYAVSGDPTIGTIVNGEDAHWIFVPFGTYRVKEVDGDGIPYEEETHPNPDYHITYKGQDMELNPPKDVYLDASLYTVESQIINTERPLGRLTITKRTDWAQKDQTKFYFTVRNERTGELVPAPKEQEKSSGWLERIFGSDSEPDGEESESLLWVITADKTNNTMETVGSLTAEGLPYGRYLVTEVDEEGNALSGSYSYDVTMDVQGIEPAYGPASAEGGVDYQNPAMAVTVTNQRNRGYLQIQKTLQDYHGTSFQDKSREFYYTVINSAGEAVDLPEEYQYRGMASIGRITDEQIHTIFVPFETYRVLETDQEGKIYTEGYPNPLYEVTNPEPVVLALENADSASAVILNREKALGSLTLVKRSDRAYEGNTFYFQVENSRGEKIPMPDAEGNPTADQIWKIDVKQSVYEMAELGRLTIRNLPYGIYKVTEVFEDGTALSGSFRYQVSYETLSQGVSRSGQEGESDIISPAVTVTVTNTRRPSGGGGNNGGGSSGGGGGRTSRTSTPPTDFIPDADVPLGGADGGDGDAMTEILDEDVPLYGLPKTGDTSVPTAGILGIMLMSLLGVAGIIKKRKEEQ